MTAISRHAHQGEGHDPVSGARHHDSADMRCDVSGGRDYVHRRHHLRQDAGRKAHFIRFRPRGIADHLAFGQADPCHQGWGKGTVSVSRRALAIPIRSGSGRGFSCSFRSGPGHSVAGSKPGTSVCSGSFRRRSGPEPDAAARSPCQVARAERDGTGSTGPVTSGSGTDRCHARRARRPDLVLCDRRSRNL